MSAAWLPAKQKTPRVTPVRRLLMTKPAKIIQTPEIMRSPASPMSRVAASFVQRRFFRCSITFRMLSFRIAGIAARRLGRALYRLVQNHIQNYTNKTRYVKCFLVENMLHLNIKHKKVRIRGRCNNSSPSNS